MIWRTIIRAFAIFLLLGTAADLVSDLHAATTTQTSSSSSPADSQPNGFPCKDTGASHACFCCCSHLTVPAHVAVPTVIRVWQTDLHLQLFAASTDIAPLFHPPRA